MRVLDKINQCIDQIWIQLKECLIFRQKGGFLHKRKVNNIYLGEPITHKKKHFSNYAFRKQNEYKSLIESGEYFGEFKTLFALESED